MTIPAVRRGRSRARGRRSGWRRAEKSAFGSGIGSSRVGGSGAGTAVRPPRQAAVPAPYCRQPRVRAWAGGVRSARRVGSAMVRKAMQATATAMVGTSQIGPAGQGLCRKPIASNARGYDRQQEAGAQRDGADQLERGELVAAAGGSGGDELVGDSVVSLRFLEGLEALLARVLVRRAPPPDLGDDRAQQHVLPHAQLPRSCRTAPRSRETAPPCCRSRHRCWPRRSPWHWSGRSARSPEYGRRLIDKVEVRRP